MVIKYSRGEVFRRTTYHMVKMGFRARQKGYHYIREAVWMVYEKPELLACVTKSLYPELAKMFSTNSRQIERGIRSAVETAWVYGNSDAIKTFFKEIYIDEEIRPTNTEIIACLADFFRC
jgi:two-component system response regulator (stage 0 sporulation protein A)